MTKQLTTQDLELLKQCDGKHENMQAIFSCDSCAVLLKEDN